MLCHSVCMGTLQSLKYAVTPQHFFVQPQRCNCSTSRHHSSRPYSYLCLFFCLCCFFVCLFFFLKTSKTNKNIKRDRGGTEVQLKHTGCRLKHRPKKGFKDPSVSSCTATCVHKCSDTDPATLPFQGNALLPPANTLP